MRYVVLALDLPLAIRRSTSSSRALSDSTIAARIQIADCLGSNLQSECELRLCCGPACDKVDHKVAPAGEVDVGLQRPLSVGIVPTRLLQARQGQVPVRHILSVHH
jgi:hypothetical protein